MQTLNHAPSTGKFSGGPAEACGVLSRWVLWLGFATHSAFKTRWKWSLNGWCGRDWTHYRTFNPFLKVFVFLRKVSLRFCSSNFFLKVYFILTGLQWRTCNSVDFQIGHPLWCLALCWELPAKPGVIARCQVCHWKYSNFTSLVEQKKKHSIAEWLCLKRNVRLLPLPEICFVCIEIGFTLSE